MDDISEIKRRLESIERILQEISDKLSRVESSTDGMKEHISFVNGVYANVSRPFHSLMDVADRLVGGGQPQIE